MAVCAESRENRHARATWYGPDCVTPQASHRLLGNGWDGRFRIPALPEALGRGILAVDPPHEWSSRKRISVRQHSSCATRSEIFEARR